MMSTTGETFVSLSNGGGNPIDSSTPTAFRVTKNTGNDVAVTSSPSLNFTNVTSFGPLTSPPGRVTYVTESPSDYEDWFLQQKNEEFTRLLLPAIVFLALLCLIGVGGNVVVLYVYNQKLRKGTIRWFVQALAVFDLLSCLVAIPGEIIDMCNNYTFGLSYMCKVLRTVSMFCSVSSGMALLVVAVERYKRICHPHSKQISAKGAQVIIAVCTVAAAICAAPASVIYGKQTKPTDNPNIKGSDCSTSDAFQGTVIPLAFSSFQFLLFLVGAMGLIVLYLLIARRICSHARFRRGAGLSLASRRMSYVFTGSDCSSPTTEELVFTFPAKKSSSASGVAGIQEKDSSEGGSPPGRLESNGYVSHSCGDSNGNDIRKTSQTPQGDEDSEGEKAEKEVPEGNMKSQEAPVADNNICGGFSDAAIVYDKPSSSNNSNLDGEEEDGLCSDENESNRRTDSPIPRADVSEESDVTTTVITQSIPTIRIEGKDLTNADEAPTKTIDTATNNNNNNNNNSTTTTTTVPSHLSVPQQNGPTTTPVTSKETFSKAFDTFRKNKLVTRQTSRDRHRSGDSLSAKKGRYLRRGSQHTQADIQRFLRRSNSIGASNGSSSAKSTTRQTTFMLFLITVVYLLSFLPYLVLMVLKALDRDSLSGGGDGWVLAQNVLLRSYFINSMANPIIYSFCSRTFRAECCKLAHFQCCRCCSCCSRSAHGGSGGSVGVRKPGAATESVKRPIPQ